MKSIPILVLVLAAGLVGCADSRTSAGDGAAGRHRSTRKRPCSTRW